MHGYSYPTAALTSRDQHVLRSSAIKFRWFRFVVFVAAVIAAFMCGAMVQVLAGNDTVSYTASNIEPQQYSTQQQSPPQAVMVTVLPGDTLWDLAAMHAPKGADVRQYIYKIKKLNNLETSILSIGQLLQMP